MADPATIAFAVKTAIAAASDKRTWKAIGVLIAAVLTPFILIIVMIMSLLSGTAQHNGSAVDMVFNGGSISAQVPAEYRQYIEDMCNSFSDLDGAVSEITPQIESGSIDSTRVKSIFYSLYFGQRDAAPILRPAAQKFVSCFVRYEKRTRTVTDKDGKKTEETYTVAVPISDLNEIYTNLESTLGRTITEENKVNAAQIYSRVLYGHSLPENENIGEDEWKKGIGADDVYTGGDNFTSPLGANWRSMITSEFGWRPNPFGGSSGEGHSGLDLGAPKGTPIHAARDGVVSSVVDSGSSGYGYHVVIDHGDGMVTLYGHCSKVYVRSGQVMKKGDVIAAVGSTGRSTGNHLHFEIRVNGKAVNPRSYLP
ncbi:M23 family metallopeptidase [Caproiciproducens sp.]|uniref:M23 family metallopeptidase n=1 Tax=Caproiciproducens sp. TaxID=1954376 RepID=UPI00289E8A8F|nr:M23 family metallopeptidase [Caproiciproducens sp.]